MIESSFKKKLIHSGISTALIRAAGAILSLSIAILLSRSLSVIEFGEYTFYLTLITAISFPISKGVQQLLVREISKNELKKEWGLLKGIIKRTYEFILFIAIISIGIYLSIKYINNNSFNDNRVLIMMALTLLISTESIHGGILRGFRRIALSQMVDKIIRPVFFLLLVIILYKLNYKLDSIQTLIIQVAAGCISFIISIFWVRKYFPKSYVVSMPEYKNKEWSASILPLSFIFGIQVLLEYTDIIMLGIISSNEDVAIYRVSVQMTSIVTFSLSVVNIIISPYISRLYHSGDIKKLRGLLAWVIKIILIIALPLLLVLVNYGEEILILLFTEKYIGAYYPLLILLAAQLINISIGPVILTLSMTGKEKNAMSGIISAGFINVILNAVMIPIWGIMGAAIATATSSIIRDIILFYKVRSLIFNK